MPRKKSDPEQNLVAVREGLDGLETGKSDALRDRVRSLVPALVAFRSLCASVVEPEITARGAQARLLDYFRRHPRQLIDGLELNLVSGISEWARRVRELRREEGWRIYSGVTFKEIAEEDESAATLTSDLGFDPRGARPNQYILMSADQDQEAKARWKLANGLRKQVKGGLAIRDGIERYLRANLAVPVTGEELRYIANDKSEWARRVRELRTELGYPVLTKSQGRIDLPVGVYVLESDRRFEPHDRKIADATRVTVLQRDNFSCRICGWSRARSSPDDPRKNLELHHLEHHAAGGSNEANNLITLCNVHHDDVHADRIPTQDLIAALADSIRF